MIKPMTDARARLEHAGLEATPRRIAVLEALAALPHAPAAQELLDTVRRTTRMDKVTLYRTLDLLVEAGILQRHSGADGTFRHCMAPAGKNAAHGHFQCTRCGVMTCLPSLPAALDAAALLPAGVTVEHVEVRLDGVCGRCQRG
ncbi:transcriptional repressor [Nitratidesulfovibrio liaohensis]|uniref:Transcriptional repressor n=1 Tax=Nitratidesulfovibrio liaohensis TaxID=2604158 RepID=A0ABY9R375_9BACT|nr:transcriptional repressor [Nitratidesulfovibrio liaohensis]WMW65647.1 transcriptional repressor [Nitratidesulfovibrio liaohensis]